MEQVEAAANAVVGRRRRGGQGVPSRQEQVLLASQVGERLREAREMQGYSQVKAAQMLGYANSTKLAKIEGGRDSSQIPLWVVKRAGVLYDVSIDYLLGNTESMEVGEVRNHAARDAIILMREEWERIRWRDMVATREVQDRLEAVESLVTLLVDQVGEAEDALARVEELNPRRWDNVKGGARLQSAVDRAAATGRTAQGKLKRLHRDARSAAGGVQPELELVYT
ncbi:helix-turn-helix transcriptional regulator [Halomonas sp. OfavH-34-E]|uniref:helix-turn-helix domain-containing protein n=1 Tax=Halomonas sp. OfavH-34-E TaxID=2954491 RepID=UPI0020975090|nr:helix-turn-helix transcriptional regulator [Halomonas sp. OfavH-34-E]MCO7216862.1 helix-turn-helix domain-containing protein [Halomonas sp. OfavH-34-E]